jgi:hypothetical protein
MRSIAIALMIVLLAGSASANWGYLVNESNVDEYASWGSSEAILQNGSVWGTVPDVRAVLDASENGQINHTTYWKYYNNMQWFMKPYPKQLKFRSQEVAATHILIRQVKGDFYLIGARMTFPS